MQFFTNFNRPAVRAHVPTGEVLVETAGYVPLEQQIMQMSAASLALQQFRASSYMYKDGSLAERDMSMPADIFADKMEAMDAARELALKAARKTTAPDGDASAPKKEEEFATTTTQEASGDSPKPED